MQHSKSGIIGESKFLNFRLIIDGAIEFMMKKYYLLVEKKSEGQNT